SHHEPDLKRGTAARDAPIRKSCSPFIPLVAPGVASGLDGCPECLSCRSCKTTPRFWMPDRGSLVAAHRPRVARRRFPECLAEDASKVRLIREARVERDH